MLQIVGSGKEISVDDADAIVHGPSERDIVYSGYVFYDLCCVSVGCLALCY